MLLIYVKGSGIYKFEAWINEKEGNKSTQE